MRTGLDTDERIDEKPFRARYNLVAHYLLYAGRIEKGKGLETVFNAFRAIRSKDYVDLVLIGKKLMDLPGDDGIKYLGYLSEEEKLAAFKGAMLSLQPSPLESLSITTLESFSQKTPVLVNRRSPALVEHIRLSGAGFAYEDENELVEGFRKIYHNRLLRKRMGEAGFAYVRQYFSWDKVIDRIETVIRETAARLLDLSAIVAERALVERARAGLDEAGRLLGGFVRARLQRLWRRKILLQGRHPHPVAPGDGFSMVLGAPRKGVS